MIGGEPAHPSEKEVPAGATSTPPTKGRPPSLKKPGPAIQLAGNIVFYILEVLNILYKFIAQLFGRKKRQDASGGEKYQKEGRVSAFPIETFDSTSASFVMQKPTHVSFVLAGASPSKDTKPNICDPFFTNAAKLVWYAIACDVRYISLYDPHGYIKSTGKAFADKVLAEVKKNVVLLNDHFNSKDKCQILLTVVTQDKEEEESLHFSFSPQKGLLDDKPLSQDPLTTFNVRLYDSSDGREDIVNLTKEIAENTDLDPSEVTQDYISSHLKGINYH